MSTDDDPYSVLGVPRGASERQVELAFHDIAFRLRADRNPGDAKAAAELARATSAYEELKAAEWFLPGEPGSVPFGAEPPSFFDSSPEPEHELWADGTPVHYPSPEDVERLRRGVKVPNANKTILWLTFAVIVITGLAALSGDPNERSDWPSIQLEGSRTEGYYFRIGR